MSTGQRKPGNLLEAIRYFSDLDVATDYVAKLRWPNGPVCPRCESTEYSYLKTRRVWKCRSCKKQYSVKVGTIFEDSPLGLDKWLPAVWLAANSKNGISSHELGRALGVTQKSAWFMLHRIRLVMQTGSLEKLAGEVEVDETYIGGKGENMHASDPRRQAMKKGGRSARFKTPVLGMRTREGHVRAEVVPNVGGPVIQSRVRAAVEPGSTLYTDAWRSYLGLGRDFDHAIIDHAEKYVEGRVHTNGIENFWSLLKRGLHGSYVSVAPFHLFRYLDERVFTYNLREHSDRSRFEVLLSAAAGRRLTYQELTAK